MKANIYSHKELIGTTELIVGVEGMGCVFGDFIPTDSYFKDIQKTVWEFWKTDEPDYTKWNSLRFNVQLENCYFLFPLGGYTFDDLVDLPNEPKRIDIAGLDRHVIEDFFLQETPRPFLEEPWFELSVERKIGLENELYKEIGLTETSLFDFLKLKHKTHKLADFEFSALATTRCCDDVLFAINKKNFDKKFAIIHLTWKGKKEVDGFPGVDFFDNFDCFKFERMYPDKVEWEY